MNKLNMFNKSKFKINKWNQKGATSVDSWMDYLLFFVMGLFGIIFILIFLSFSLLARHNYSVQAAESLQQSENLINQQKAQHYNGQEIDIPNLRSRVIYINTYKQQPDKEIGLQST